MTTPEDLAAQLAAQLPRVKVGSVAVFGDIFGGRVDNIHVVVGARADGDALVVDLNHGEVLSVWHPEGMTATEDEFLIRRASRVRWEWHHYGREPTVETRFFIEHVVRDGRIEVATDTGRRPSEFSPSATAPAVEILGW